MSSPDLAGRGGAWRLVGPGKPVAANRALVLDGPVPRVLCRPLPLGPIVRELVCGSGLRWPRQAGNPHVCSECRRLRRGWVCIAEGWGQRAAALRARGRRLGLNEPAPLPPPASLWPGSRCEGPAPKRANTGQARGLLNLECGSESPGGLAAVPVWWVWGEVSSFRACWVPGGAGVPV